MWVYGVPFGEVFSSAAENLSTMARAWREHEATCLSRGLEQ